MTRLTRLMLVMSLAVLAAPCAAARAGDVATGGPDAFVAAHGRRSAVFGYSAQGLEVWAYPLQVLSGYRLSFREPSRTAPLDGQALLRRIEVGPAGTVRVYVGPDFVVRERLRAAANAPGVRIDYEVEGRPDVKLEARFAPSLDLMWPGALGGQELSWDEARRGYVEREAVHGFSAVIASPEAIAHDAPVNAAVSYGGERALVLQPRAIPGTGVARASLLIAADLKDAATPTSPTLTDAAWDKPAAAPAQDESLRLVTPDPAFDAPVRDAERALDQAWVCAPRIGCGEVAGYGPSRPGRRPQYAWFFAGDGLVAADGLMATSRYDRARDELAFVARFQNPSNGMIWHEMSLSAPYIDWARYPYMYVHVDITLQYLATLARYEKASGDGAFLQRMWPGVAAAWRYADGLLDARTGLPTIPPGKEGQDEQHKLADDVRLSSAWIEAADAMAELDARMGHARDAAEVKAQATRARQALARGAWDPATRFWVEGHTLDGRPVRTDRSDAIGMLNQHVFTPAQVDAALDHLATPAFRSDWGERSQSAASPDYDPNAYSQGAVWGLGTSAAAEADWRAHRPLAAWSLLQGLAGWNTLDSPGHIHEVLAGDLYHPEVESVPEQTWSSAGLLLGAVDGLLGLEVDASAGRLRFQPHLPGDWDGVEADGVRVGATRLDLRLRRTTGELELDATDEGAPVALDFAPEIPLGAADVTADIDGRAVPVVVEAHDQDQHAKVTFRAGPGRTRVSIHYTGGVRLAPIVDPPKPGDASRNIQVASVRMRDGRLTVTAYVADPAHADLAVLTPLRIVSASGAAVRPARENRFVLSLTPQAGAAALPGGYRPATATVVFAPAAGGHIGA